MLATIINGIKEIGGVLIPPLRKKYFDQPKIYVALSHIHSSKSPLGPSSKNDFSKALSPVEVIYFNHLEWQYTISFRNNSDHVAYNLRVVSPEQNQEFNIYPKIDALKPILSNGEVSHTANFYQFYEGRGEEANKLINVLPKRFQVEPLILEYTNVKGTKFYTIYKLNEDGTFKHEFLRRLSK